MADTSFPAVDTASSAHSASTRMGNSGDTSWAGWAISSFTNKMTTARGEMQPSVNDSKSTVQKDSRPISLPLSGRSTPTSVFPLNNASAGQTEQERISSTPTQMDEEADDAFQAWGTVEEEEEEEAFFDAPSSGKGSPIPPPTSKYEDQGEPDFAGWLAAQSQAKSKKALPKGLMKTSNAGPGLTDRTTSTGTMGSGVGPRKLLATTSKPRVTVPAKKVDTKPKEPESAEDGWGDDWD